MGLVQNARFLLLFNRFMKEVGKMNSLTQLLPSLIALVTGAVSIFSPQLQAFITAHPAIAGAVAAVYAILSHLMPSPVANK